MISVQTFWCTCAPSRCATRVATMTYRASVRVSPAGKKIRVFEGPQGNWCTEPSQPHCQADGVWVLFDRAPKLHVKSTFELKQLRSNYPPMHTHQCLTIPSTLLNWNSCEPRAKRGKFFGGSKGQKLKGARVGPHRSMSHRTKNTLCTTHSHALLNSTKLQCSRCTL